jgi:hypothetical protein
MYSCEQDPTATAARATFADTGYHHRACAAPRSLQPAAAHRRGQQVVLPAAVQPRRAKSKKHGAAASSSSRRSSTTVVATDVNNFRAMVQELTGFPPAAIFRPLPRRVHAASPFVGVAGGAGQGCSGGSERRGHGGSEATNNSTAAAACSPDAAAAALPVMAPPPPPPQCAPLGVFDGLADLGSPEFDSWGDLSIE